MALSDCSHQLVWTSNLLCKIGFDIPVPHLYGDNLGSLFWSTNPVQEKRSKYIDIWYNYVRDAIEDDKIKLYYIDGARNPADILTKNLGQILFHQFCPLLGLEILQTFLLIYCKKAKLQARIKPIALCPVINKENLIESPLDFPTLLIQLLHGLCTTFPHLSCDTVTSCHVTVTCDTCDVTLSHTPFCVVQEERKRKRKEKKI